MSSTPQEPAGQPAQGDSDPTYTGMPGWVKWFVIAAGVILAVLLLAKLVGGEHGPARHSSPDLRVGPTFASSLAR